MTGNTVAVERGMIHYGYWHPGGSRMTAVTLQGCGNMIRGLAGCHHIIMTTAAGAVDLAVIHR